MAYQELKFFNTDFDVTLATTGTIRSSLNLIGQGDGESQRVGRKVVVSSIAINGNWALADTTSANSGTAIVRMIIYIDHQCNGAAAGVLDILNTNNYQAHDELRLEDRFTILVDDTLGLNKSVAAGNGTANDLFGYSEPYIMQLDVHIPISFSGDTGALTEITGNNIGVLTIANRIEGAPRFESKVRLRYDG